jgi:hypothetical protein
MGPALPHHPDRPQHADDPATPELSTINDKKIADFTRVVEQTGILAGPTYDVASRTTYVEPTKPRRVVPSEWRLTV